MKGLVSDAGLLVLASLAAGDKHGYAIQQDVLKALGVRLGPGTLYGAIQQLEALGYIEPVAESGRRRPYRLTPRGLTALRERVDVLGRVVETTTARLATR